MNEFESFKENLRRWDKELSHEEFRTLLTEIVWICEEILDAEEPGIDALADPKAYVRDLLHGPSKPKELK